MFYVGVDLGQKRDYSAIVAVERREVRRAFLRPEEDALLVRHVERVPLGTTYPAVVARVREVVKCPELAGQCSVAVDGTGVGAPVVEMMRSANLGCEIVAVTITGGERAHVYRGPGGSGWSVPKLDLVAGLQTRLERGELRIGGKAGDVGLLVRELMDMRATPRRGGMRFGADGAGEHDDLVIALGLACWRAGWRRNGFGTGRLPGI